MPPVLVLQRNSGLRARVRAGVRSGAAHGLVDGARFASGWRELGRLTREFPGSPAFVDTHHGAEGPSPSGMLSFQREHPASPLIGYAAMDERRRAGLGAVRVPLVALLAPGSDDGLLRIASTVLLAADYDSVRRLTERLRAVVPREAHPLVERLIRRTVDPCRVQQLAQHAGSCRRTLRRRCSAWGLASPRKLVALAKLFHVERLARWSGRPRGAVALALAYSDYANYKRAVRREFGRPPSAFGRSGGVDEVAARLLNVATAPTST